MSSAGSTGRSARYRWRLSSGVGGAAGLDLADVPCGAALAGLSRLAAAGKLTLRVADTYPLADAARAHERLQAGGVRGRIVLVP